MPSSLADRPVGPAAAITPARARRRSRRGRFAGRERVLLFTGLALVTVHLLDLALSGPATTVAGVAGILAVPVLAALLQPRVTRATRGAAAIVFGLLFAGFGTAAHVLDLFTSGPRWTDLTGVAFAAGGVLVAASGVAAILGSRPPRPRPTPARRAAHVVGWLVGAAVLFQFVLFPAATALLITHAARVPVDEPALGAGQRTVSIPAPDGDRVAATYLPSRNGATVLMAHGAGGNRGRIGDQAELVARRGYGVLAVDLPGHGESDGHSSLLGDNAQPAIDASLDWLVRQPDVDADRIAGYGMSLGGEVLLEAAARDPRLAAVVSDGAQRASDDRELGIGDGLERTVTAISLGMVRGISGMREAPPLTGLVDRIGPRPVLLVAAGVPPHEAEVNAVYRRLIGPSAEQWTVPGAGHTAGVRERPAEYARRVTGFLERAL
jgi:hypothetical protein